MTPALSHPTACEIRSTSRSGASGGQSGRPRLLSTDDGWSLVGSDGEMLFRGLGAHGRRQCLEEARARGILAVFS
jgi:hypothetical protein